MAYQLDGVTLKPGRPFETHDGTQYPGDWLAQSTPVERAELGIVWVEPTPAPYYDQRFYWGVGNPKDLAELKTLWKAKQKEAANSLLRPTDWAIIRGVEETGKPPSVALKASRKAVRDTSTRREAAIDACLTTDELASLITAPATITVVTTPYAPATYDDQGVELTPEVLEVTEQQPNPAALEAWPDVISN